MKHELQELEQNELQKVEGGTLITALAGFVAGNLNPCSIRLRNSEKILIKSG